MKKTIISLSAAVILSGCGTMEHGMVSGETIRDEVRQGLSQQVNAQVPINGTLTVEEAVARALKYNLNQRLEQLKVALSKEQIRVSQAGMLPQLVANADYNARSKYDASYSVNTGTGAITGAGNSSSSEKSSLSSSLRVSWNVLDFGLSYVRAKQAQDRALIAAERRRKVTQELVNDVQSRYWRAYSAQMMSDVVKQIEIRLAAAKRNQEAVLEKNLTPPVETLTSLREVLNLQLQLKTISRELSENKARLAVMMGMLPNARYDLQPSETALSDMKVDYKKLEDYALQHRPELREDEYNLRISRDEVTAAMLGMLPGLTLNAGINNTTDDAKVNQDWLTGSLSVGMNLFNLVSAPAKVELAKTQESIIKQRKLVVGSAVLMSVRLAWLNYWEVLKNYRAVADLQDVEDQLIKKIRAQADANRIGEIELIRADISNLVNVLRYNFALSDVRDAQNRLLISIAYDPAPVVDVNTDLSDLTKTVRAMMDSWQDSVNNLGSIAAADDIKLTPALPDQA